MNPSRRRRV